MKRRIYYMFFLMICQSEVKEMKIKMNKIHILVIISTVLLMMLTPKINEMVNLTRVEHGIGGECFAWLFPVLIYGLYESLKM